MLNKIKNKLILPKLTIFLKMLKYIMNSNRKIN